MITGKLNIVIVSNDSEFAQAMGIRRSVFVDECKLDEKKEFDGNDYCATHILALDGDTPVGTMRIRYFNGFVKMERMCVVKDYRKTDASEQIMQKGMDFVAQKGYEKVYGVCKKELLSRWQKNGFEVIPDTPLIEQNGQTLIPIFCNLEKRQDVLTMQTSAEVLNAKEGTWFDDKSAQNQSSRLKKLTEKVKLIKEENLTSEQKWFTPIIYPDLHKTDNKTY